MGLEHDDRGPGCNLRGVPGNWQAGSVLAGYGTERRCVVLRDALCDGETEICSA